MKIWIVALFIIASISLVSAFPIVQHNIKHKKWTQIKAYERFNIKRKAGILYKIRFREQLNKWKKLRHMCLNNSTNCTEYFQTTKHMIEFRIDLAIARLKTLDNEEAQNKINELEEYKETIEETNSIEEIRAIYPEIRDTIKESSLLFKRKALLDVIDVYSNILDELKDKFPNQVNEIENDLNNVKNNLYSNDLKWSLHKLKEIRGKIIALYRVSK